MKRRKVLGYVLREVPNTVAMVSPDAERRFETEVIEIFWEQGKGGFVNEMLARRQDTSRQQKVDRQ
jgi:hypothetical protein